MFSFNAAAIGQALVSVIFILLLHAVLVTGGSDYDLIGGSRELAFSVMLIAWLCMVMELFGLKGRILLLNTWLIAIAVSIFAFHFVYPDFYSKPPSLLYQAFIYGSAGLMPILYWWRNRAAMIKIWATRKATLRSLKNHFHDPERDLPAGEFWSSVEMCYLKPSKGFLFFYPLWNLIYPNTLPKQEYIQHYRDLVAMIPLESLDDDVYRRWVGELAKQLQADEAHYMHKPWSLTRLGRVIAYMERKTKGEVNGILGR